MKRVLFGSILVLVFVAAPLGSQESRKPFSDNTPVVKLPDTLKVKAGRLLQIRAQSNGRIVRWFNGRPDDSDLIPYPGEPAAIFASPTPGRYLIYAYTALGDIPSEPALCVVVVEGTSPPGPGPKPPDPTPPAPTDPFFDAVQAAYSQEPASSRNQQRQDLAAIYRAVATEVRTSNALANVGDVYTLLVISRRKLIPDEQFKRVREAIGAETEKVLPIQSDTAMSAELKTKAVDYFNRVATVLERVK